MPQLVGFVLTQQLEQLLSMPVVSLPTHAAPPQSQMLNPTLARLIEISINKIKYMSSLPQSIGEISYAITQWDTFL